MLCNRLLPVLLLWLAIIAAGISIQVSTTSALSSTCHETKFRAIQTSPISGTCQVMAFAHHRYHRSASIMAKERTEDCHDAKALEYPQLMIMFRPPSRHTYGFREGDTYDLPLLELQTVIQDRVRKDIHINFIPVIEQRSRPSADDDLQIKSTQHQTQSRNQMKKKRLKKNLNNEAGIQSLYWLECSENVIDDSILSTAASRAILTHAMFRIEYSASFSNDDWIATAKNGSQNHACLDGVDVISMSNPNMSKEECSNLLQTISMLIENHKDTTLYQLRVDEGGVLIYHHEQSDTITHHIHIGRRVVIGPAGTSSAPSQTLRRTHRGILKEYSLKNRFGEVTALARTSISTAMEPEIGFLMASLAGCGEGKRVLDPCCGSASLLLFAAALGATHLSGVDSFNGVWKGAEDEFKRHSSVIGESKRKLAVPTFYHGDVLDPTSIECLHSADSYDAIVVDPPYNIGAPVLLAGQDSRPMNYHLCDDDEESRDDCGEMMNNAQHDTIPSILNIARRVLVENGRLVFFLPVRGQEINMTLEQLLITKGWPMAESDEQLQIQFGRLQTFSRSFSRWLVCMVKTPSKVDMRN
jgi:tRNA A58 N-methylase Trm61